MSDYKDTLNLPNTKFPMRASLPKNEPKMITFWNKVSAYEQMIKDKDEKSTFVLHDGPPYANGQIHLGTAMNKILKDIIVKSQNLRGCKAEYVPGWDCHGLPIELKVEQELSKGKKEMSILDIRRKCREYALKYLDIQRKEFKRLGVLGTWENPYLTMTPEYESAIAEELTKFMKNGSIFRKKKPIHWCPSCETALAEAEVEYYNRTSPSIYVRFPMIELNLDPSKLPQGESSVYILIWTTTPWTIPSNLAVAVHPDLEYVLVDTDSGHYILAEKLFSECAEKFGWQDYKIVSRFMGTELERSKAKHPIYDQESLLVLAEYVTLETGTGCVHTAPGHGQEDYETGLKYGLDILAPVDDQGNFQKDVKYFSGLNVFDSNPQVIEAIKNKGHLMAQEELQHSYPHCWRCKRPVIFRATTQWFISMEKNGLREKALEAIDQKVQWIPSWGRLRIRNMIAQRPDWCISRQRSWGVPIIALICQDCNNAYYDFDWASSIAKSFAEHERGADYWFEADVKEIAPTGLTCPVCGSAKWKKETDILDVWFDSGTSYAAVLEKRQECKYPADMYLEGSDQHRGWFHSSLLASVGTRAIPPYRSVLTHGFVVDGKGRKMSKSIGNVVAPQEIIDKYGAEILRMWVASENYQEDLRMSEKILRQLVDNYRRIRNTCRFILGNLKDFDLTQNKVPEQKLLPLDRYVLNLLQEKHEQIMENYSKYELHKVFHTLHNICVNDLSAVYLDILKDRLYVSALDSQERRSAQTVLAKILLLLIQDMAPILSFTAEEAYQYLPEGLRSSETAMGMDIASKLEGLIDEKDKSLWDSLYLIRNEVTKAIEPKRKNGTLGHSLDAWVKIYAQEEIFNDLQSVADHLLEFFIISKLEIMPFDQAPESAVSSSEFQGLKIDVQRAPGEKCARCWHYSEKIGQDSKHTLVCPRCSQVLAIQN